jgi:hypothetical protein
MAVDRSKRYANPPKGKKGMQDKGEEGAKAEAEKTAGSPPTAEDPKGAIHKPDTGPEPGNGPAFGEVAERHGREVGEMHGRHAQELSDMHERHVKEHKDLGKRHAKEMAPDKEESGAEGKVEGDGKGPKLGKSEEKGDKGSEP